MAVIHDPTYHTYVHWTGPGQYTLDLAYDHAGIFNKVETEECQEVFSTWFFKSKEDIPPDIILIEPRKVEFYVSVYTLLDNLPDDVPAMITQENLDSITALTQADEIAVESVYETASLHIENLNL